MNFDSPTADRVTAGVFLCLGAAMTWGGFVMDRLEVRQIHPASIPGLLPMILGVVLMICAVLLALSADKAERGEVDTSASWPDFAATALWSCFFAVVLVTRVPFEVATTIYVVGFSAWFMLPKAATPAARWKLGILILIFGILVALGVSTLFRDGFLVRLP